MYISNHIFLKNEQNGDIKVNVYNPITQSQEETGGSLKFPICLIYTVSSILARAIQRVPGQKRLLIDAFFPKKNKRSKRSG